MAHNNYIKSGGIWPLFSLLTSGIMSAIDKMLFKSINGDEGGVWAPHLPGSPSPTPIIIGGDGLQVLGPFLATDAEITITSGKFITVLSGGALNLNLGSTYNLYGQGFLGSGGSLVTQGTGVIIITTVGGLVVNGTGEAQVMPGGVLRLKTAPLFGGGSLFVEAGAGITLLGTSGLFAYVSATYSTWSFTNSTVAISATGGLLNVLGTAHFQPGCNVNMEGTWQSTAAFFAALKGTWIFDGVLGTPTAVTFGQYTTVGVTAGSTWTDAGTHTVSGVYNFVSGTLTTDASSPVTFNGATTLAGTTSLTMAQPAPATSIGPNKLTGHGLVKGWGLLHVGNAGAGTVQVNGDGGLNIQSVSITGIGILVTFADDMASSNVIVIGGYFLSPSFASPTLVGTVFSTQPFTDHVILYATKGPTISSDAIDLNATAGYLTFAVFGRQ